MAFRYYYFVVVTVIWNGLAGPSQMEDGSGIAYMYLKLFGTFWLKQIKTVISFIPTYVSFIVCH